MTPSGLQRPRGSTFAENEWNVLTAFWHPIAYDRDISDRPMATTLLDERLVVFRTTGGVSVARDLCPHRGSALSRGWVEGDEIVCAYHGLRFAGDGRCTAIPAAGRLAAIPPRLRLTTFPVAERYGIVWTCLRPDPRLPLPEWPGLEDGRTQKLAMEPVEWNCGAARHVENFNDLAHLSWVHAATFGNRDDPFVPPYTVDETAHGLRRIATVNQLDRDSFAVREPTITPMRYVYDFAFPFASSLVIESPDGRHEHIFDVASPVSAGRCRIFILKARDYDLDQPIEEWSRFQEAVNEEDRAIVESQRPEELPLDLAAEFHILADAWSVAYRRKWRSFGLEQKCEKTS